MDEKDAGRAYFERDGKRDINDLLFKMLPLSATIGEMDEIACYVHDRIHDLWNRDVTAR